MANYLSNAFSLQMVQQEELNRVSIKPIPAPTEYQLSKMESVIGHTDLAVLLGVEPNRVSISLQEGDRLTVCQLQGGRLPEGSTTLPEGCSFSWIEVTIRPKEADRKVLVGTTENGSLYSVTRGGKNFLTFEDFLTGEEEVVNEIASPIETI